MAVSDVLHRSLQLLPSSVAQFLAAAPTPVADRPRSTSDQTWANPGQRGQCGLLLGGLDGDLCPGAGPYSCRRRAELHGAH